MNVTTAVETVVLEDTPERVIRYAQALSSRLTAIRAALYPPEARKTLRRFTTLEVAQLLGLSESSIRTLDLSGVGPEPQRLPNGRRAFTLDQINALRAHFAAKRSNPLESLDILPRRRPGDKLQAIAISNFKGGSGKTTTSVHLTHFLALQGLRVLAIDLDPQASLTSMFGIQPEFDVGPNETLYAAVRYDAERRPLAEVIRPTYFDGIDLVPANLELAEFEHDTPRALAARDGAATLFFERIARALGDVEDRYDVVVMDCPPQLGFLTLGALFAATGVLVTVHPAMLDVASMSQFLLMAGDLMAVVRDAGGRLDHDFLKFVLTRHDPNDHPQLHVVALLRSLFADAVLKHPVVETTAIANAGIERKSLYEMEKSSIGRDTLARALESVDAVNAEVFDLMKAGWGRAGGAK
ncbi:plasmid partitioning protein RepA [Oryzibacter oryziterrae]|uniref:plasmid partitioning protein RepA n=1 Tax=Oryzibacter oryziterrae TaxID=2766474 RepID=UPI001F3337FC|nr:plasmid partitioning protein RepA [Oryzibacter oryziterrae]